MDLSDIQRQQRELAEVLHAVLKAGGAEGTGVGPKQAYAVETKMRRAGFPKVMMMRHYCLSSPRQASTARHPLCAPLPASCRPPSRARSHSRFKNRKKGAAESRC
jgi:hypothetical protein